MKKRTLKSRIEHDVFGDIEVPASHYWGSNTQRSLIHFSIGTELIPIEFIYTYALFKLCAAKANHSLGLLDRKLATPIISACSEIMKGQYNEEFPLHIWQTGSGTQTNMNVNEVVANICNKKLTGKMGTKTPVHPNNHVNLSQSSNDSFITVIHMFVGIHVHSRLIPSVELLYKTLKAKQIEFKHVVKIGRTHLQDAVPITFGQEFSGYAEMIADALKRIQKSMSHIHQLAAGGTAVGTGINAHPQFGKTVATYIKKHSGIAFSTAPNKYAEMSSHNALLETSDAMKVLATNLTKIAGDLRLMGAGPVAGIHEINLPQNEPGSSIMPGKVNPTQCEAAIMASLQVITNNLAITIANSNGNFELNVFNPLMLYNITQSMNLMTDICTNFSNYCIAGITINHEKVQYNVENSLSLATALNPHIGYDKATKLAHYAYDHGMSLRDANKKLQFLPDNDLVRWLNPSNMV